MIAGHLQAKKGNWYVVLSLKDEKLAFLFKTRRAYFEIDNIDHQEKDKLICHLTPIRLRSF